MSYFFEGPKNYCFLRSHNVLYYLKSSHLLKKNLLDLDLLSLLLNSLLLF